ncbi:Rossmann-fold NAD(P)-binding domain-containing protein [Streptomyces chattanoogensis]|uniref:hypothetical protein n=1 Tax=Streptomyces chattanoogensis TaxID=66876 RepID=UPI0005D96FFA|nr:hypothetical protein T261_0159 [Streptomyces lydicus]
MEDVDSLTAEVEGAGGPFSVQPTAGSPGTAPDFAAEDEALGDTNVVEASYAASVEHVVFTFVAAAERRLEVKLPVNLGAGPGRWE